MNKTSIEYLGYTVNPIAMRCTRVSPACDHCWHLDLCDMRKLNPKTPPQVREAYAGGPPLLLLHRMDAMMRRKKPAIIGMQFMGDLFHPSIPFEWVLTIFGRMNRAKQHTCIVCTKRPERAVEFCHEYGLMPDPHLGWRTGSGQTWPGNVWFLTTIEDQERANIRVPQALQVPAPVVGVSVEPMLGPIDMRNIQPPGKSYYTDALEGISFDSTDCYCEQRKIGWVVVGGETGSTRPMHPEWARGLRDQCRATGVPFFFKQWGAYKPVGWVHAESRGALVRIDGHVCRDRSELFHSGNFEMLKVHDKKNAGNLLDGQEWRQMPEVAR